MTDPEIHTWWPRLSAEAKDVLDALGGDIIPDVVRDEVERMTGTRMLREERLTARDREICERLKPELKRRGLIFTGIDVIGPYLTEINVTSPTGIRQIEAFGGPNVSALFWDAVEARVSRT